jgi:hypothetical protein
MNNPSIAEWCTLALIAGIVICFTKPAIQWWRRRPWQIKGRSLRGATAIVESVTPLPSIPATSEAGDDTQLRCYFLVNVTIKPVARAITIPWMPSALRIVPAGSWHIDRPDNTELDRYSRIELLELVCGAISFVPEDGFAVVGQFDLRLRVSVRRNIRVIQFRYYLEQFGAFPLPAPSSAVMATGDLMIRPQPVSANGS